MNEDSNIIPKEIIPDKYIFRKSYLSRSKTNYSFFNNKKRDTIEENKILKLNSNFKPLSKNNSIRIKLLHSKFLSKNNNDSFSLLKSSNLSHTNEDKNKDKINNIKMNKTFFKKLKSISNNSKNAKIDNSILTDRIKMKNSKISKILKKSNSCETVINKNIIINNNQNDELVLKNKKNELKIKLKKDMQKHFIIDKATLQKYNLLFKIGLKRKTNKYIEGLKNDPDEAINKNNLYNINNSFDNKNSFKINNNYYNCFSVFKSTFRYEDYYFTPLEFLNKYFNNNDIVLMKSFPAYFGLNKSPFKEADLIFKPTLLQKMQYEEKIKNKKKKKLNLKSFYLNLNRNGIKIRKSKSENKKSYKNIFNFRNINIINNNNTNRKIFKFNPFIPNYEREIEPNEGTEEYYEQKYAKYLKNKKIKIKEKIENNNYKKSKFEFLKNEHVQKMNSELEIQRISRPILETIRKNYIISNYLINHPKML